MDGVSGRKLDLPDYQIVRELGRGAMGIVLLANHRGLGRAVAIKLLTVRDSKGMLEQRFRREARLYARLSHPNLVRIYSAEPLADPPYIVLEYIEGMDLVSAMARGPAPAAVDVGRDVAAALAYVHEQGILHRDLKPANVMLRPDGTAVLMDFGIAKSETESDQTVLTAVGARLGTPLYMAPEVVEGKEADAASDVYALGLVLFELAGGTVAPKGVPWREVIERRMAGPMPTLSELKIAAPAALEALLERALARERAERPSAQEMATTLAALAAGESMAGVKRLESRPERAEAPPSQPARAGPAVQQAGSRPHRPATAPDRRTETHALSKRVGTLRRLRMYGWLAAATVAGTLALGLLQPRKQPVKVEESGASPAQSRAPALPGRITTTDGANMVLIPGGWFTMGWSSFPDERPVHRVLLDPFYMDVTEVTNRQYARFLRETGRRPPVNFAHKSRAFDLPDHPVVGVEWDDAAAYARWAGKRLPTEAEWERAARFTDSRAFPWGAEITGKAKRANFLDKSGSRNAGIELPPVLIRAFEGVEDDDGFDYTAPVGSFPLGASAEGVLDLAGNAAEWCQDWFSRTSYGDGAPRSNPTGPASGAAHVVRGGAWSTFAVVMSGHNRFCWPDEQGELRGTISIGFRCVRPARATPVER